MLRFYPLENVSHRVYLDGLRLQIRNSSSSRVINNDHYSQYIVHFFLCILMIFNAFWSRYPFSNEAVPCRSKSCKTVWQRGCGSSVVMTIISNQFAYDSSYDSKFAWHYLLEVIEYFLLSGKDFERTWSINSRCSNLGVLIALKSWTTIGTRHKLKWLEAAVLLCVHVWMKSVVSLKEHCRRLTCHI